MSSKNHDEASVFKSWMQLVRVPAIPSAITNVLTGFLLAHHSWWPLGDVLLLCLCSACLYASGMILNDICDVEADKRINPSRPIASDRISKLVALLVYLALTVSALVLASTVGSVTLWSTLILAISIFLYDCILKRTIVAPVFMGLCRSLNILLGASSSEGVLNLQSGVSGPVWVAFCLGILVTGVTYLARNEREIVSLGQLRLSTIVISLGVIFYSLSPIAINHNAIYFIAFVALIFSIVWVPGKRTFAVMKTAQPNVVRPAVIAWLKSFIFLDAAICFLAMPDQFFYALVILSFILPARILGKSISST